MLILAIFAAAIIWFIAAGILFFNPWVDKIYRKEDSHPAVRSLPKNAKSIGKILLAVLIQSSLWAYVYTLVSPVLAGSKIANGLVFGVILIFTKIIPRDIDRILLTTYPKKRMTIEFIIGAIASLVVGLVFGYLL